MGNGKALQKYWRKSLGTKDRREAARRAVHALAEYDRILKKAEALIEKRERVATKRTSLSPTGIARTTEAYFGQMLAEDEEQRLGGRAYAERSIEWIKRNENPDFALSYPLDSIPEFGIQR